MNHASTHAASATKARTRRPASREEATPTTRRAA
jgi:hypothetical protein